MPLIKQFALHWPRNGDNPEEIEDVAGHKTGVYVLGHGAMPVYVGRGAISARLSSHVKEGSRKEQFWDRFSWFAVGEFEAGARIGVMAAGSVAIYVRSLNKQTGKLWRKLPVAAPNRELMDVALPLLVPGPRGRRA